VRNKSNFAQIHHYHKKERVLDLKHHLQNNDLGLIYNGDKLTLSVL